MLVITLHDIKTKKKRVFTIGSECSGYEIYQKYSRLRLKQVKHNRFFIYFNLNINSFVKIPQKVAEYLKLPDASSFRRTSTTFLADSGPGIQILKRHEGWQSISVAEGYIEESIVVENFKKYISTARTSGTSRSFGNAEGES
ncbi:hypothetical protein JTB14_023105 [Gonioctena quinquepunctata]|nr:hypothetical protein JTB14_023105 [Gonioctena quinquepunctata]